MWELSGILSIIIAFLSNMRYYLAHGLTGPRAHGHTSPRDRTAIQRFLMPKSVEDFSLLCRRTQDFKFGN
jgi:hypothetical protein